MFSPLFSSPLPLPDLREFSLLIDQLEFCKYKYRYYSSLSRGKGRKRERKTKREVEEREGEDRGEGEWEDKEEGEKEREEEGEVVGLSWLDAFKFWTWGEDSLGFLEGRVVEIEREIEQEVLVPLKVG